MNRCTGDGSCDGFVHKFQKMESIRPSGSGGNGVTTTNYPYGITPVKYFPSGSSSVGRSMWDGWRYGAGHIGPNQGKVYGEPDYKYYRHNYCGPCGCAPPGYMGDPNGQNPNIRYVQLDYRSLLGSGFAQQGLGHSQTSQLQMGQDQLSPTHTSCGKQHCTECSGVFKKKQQPVKFQVCIGDPNCPETMQPCPKQDVRVYVPTQMLPRPQNENGSGDTEDGEREEEPKQDYEIQIPGHTDCPKDCPPQGDVASTKQTVWEDVNPCGSCNACKTPTAISQKPTPFLVRPTLQKIKCGPCCQKNTECKMNGQLYTSGPVLCNVKKPNRQTNLRKRN